LINCGIPTTSSHKVAHGLSRTAISELRYGTTKGAFLSGFVSSGFSVGKGAGPGGAFVMAIVGGTASAIGGGKFANGAMGSAFQYMFNEAAGNILAKSNEMNRLDNLSDSDFIKEMNFSGIEDDIINAKLSLMLQIRNDAIIQDLPQEFNSGVKTLTSAIPTPKVDSKSLLGVFDFFNPKPSNLRFEYNCHTVGNCGVKIYE
jgi:hypothetical protein